MRGRAVVAYQAHTLKVVGSIPTPATNLYDARRNNGKENADSEDLYMRIAGL